MSKAANSSSLPLAAAQFGSTRYELVRYLGRGGNGVVYEVFDKLRERSVALKTLTDSSPQSLFRFKREFRVLQGIRHQNLVRLYEFVSPAQLLPFFTMELVRGTDLRRYTRRAGALIKTIRPVPALDVTRPTLSSPAPLPAAGGGATLRPSQAPRGPSPAHPERLREALLQLAAGVNAIHSAGKLHRDIKPSNTMVTAEGRVVLLDFGLATELMHRDTADEVVGTPTYMAPEQVLNQTLGPASDWYSIGVLLFDALVGRPPFSGDAADMLHCKLTQEPPRPSALADDVPPDLDELCWRLLAKEAERRPSAEQILGVLSGGSSGGRRVSGHPVPVNLIGRSAEYQRLEQLLASARQGQPAAVCVRGASGVGKSTLVQHFADRSQQSEAAMVLSARVYEQESLPYKAVDGIIDALSARLEDEQRAGRPLPVSENVAALACLFPVLRRIAAISALQELGNGDPLKTRRMAVAALGELLDHVREQRAVMLIVDDAQWGDDDSLGLLIELITASANLPLLLIFTHRDEPRRPGSFLTTLVERWPAAVPLEQLQVGPLSIAEVHAVIRQLMGRAVSETLASQIYRESAGNAFLVRELAYVAQLGGMGNDRPSIGDFKNARIGIEDVIDVKLTALDATARQLLELVAVSGRPLPVATVSAVIGVVAPEQMIGALEQRRLVRSVQRDGHEMLETSHDRIRQSVVATLPAARRREYHRQLAEALEASVLSEPDALMTHWLEAGQRQRAQRVAARAAAEAAERLAFKRAEQLYRIAIENVTGDGTEQLTLYKKLAQVLEWDGRGAEAAQVYALASTRTSGVERSELESAAGIQFLYAGDFDAGVRVLRSSLESLGIRVPDSLFASGLGLAAGRLRLAFVDARAVADAPAATDATRRARVEALYSAAFGLVFSNPVLSEYLQSQHILAALRDGDSLQRARALALEASHRAKKNGEKSHRSAEEFFARAEAIASTVADPACTEFVKACRGVSQFLRGEWRSAHGLLETAYRDVPQHRAGWHTNAAIYEVFSLINMGRYSTAGARLPELLRGAKERGDRFTTIALQVSASTPVSLAADRLDDARRALGETELSSGPTYLIQHWRAMYWSSEIELFAGDQPAALAACQRDEERLKRSLLLKIQYIRAMTLFLRLRCELAAHSPARNATIARTQRLIDELEREGKPWTNVFAQMGGVALAVLRGRTENALVQLHSTIAAAERASMFAHADACRLLLGMLLGADEGRELTSEASARLQSNGVRSPLRFAATLLPGCWK